MHHRAIASGLFVLLAALAGVADALDLDTLLRRDSYESIKLSPDGAHYAATVPLADRTVLVVIRRSDGVATAKIEGPLHSEIDRFHWVGNGRVVASIAQRIGVARAPQPTGQLYAVSVDGSRGLMLADPNARPSTRGVWVAAFLLDPLRDSPRHVLASVMHYRDEPRTAVDRIDVYTGERTPVASAPVRRAHFVTDHAGNVRFAVGAGSDNVSKLYHRGAAGGEWQLVNDEAVSGIVEWPLGFAADGRTAVLRAQRSSGPDVLIGWDPADGSRRELLADPHVDPFAVIFEPSRRVPVGALYAHERIEARFFDETTPDPAAAFAHRWRSLEQAFPGHAIAVTSATDDGRLLLVEVWSDRNPGDFYLYDTAARRVEQVFARRRWLDPQRVPATRLVSLPARDGLLLHGYLTEPRGSAPWPLVVLPHGGPFGVFDHWGFDDEAVLLAASGYAVLRVNFRGSGNYGRAFMHAGARQWGRRMQDDVIDATRWAIDAGIAAADRICIVGASYGAYAALLGAAVAPELYACAVGHVGVYDLQRMVDDDAGASRASRTWLDDWIGPRDTLADLSVIDRASSIRAAVLLTAGGRDTRAPIVHSRRLERALRRAGVDVDTLYIADEAHGFHAEANRRAYHERLLAFLARHLRGAGERQEHAQ